MWIRKCDQSGLNLYALSSSPVLRTEFLSVICTGNFVSLSSGKGSGEGRDHKEVKLRECSFLLKLWLIPRGGKVEAVLKIP